MFSFETLTKKTKRVVTEEDELEIIEKSQLLALFGTFGPPKLGCK